LKNFIALLLTTVALFAASPAPAAPNAQEEQFALEAATLLMLSSFNCDLADDLPAAMKMVDKAYEAAGVKVADYQPAGAAVRGPQSAAAPRCIGLLLFTSPLLAASLACQNNNLATSDNYFKFKVSPKRHIGRFPLSRSLCSRNP
jgi:hypothetical protein